MPAPRAPCSWVTAAVLLGFFLDFEQSKIQRYSGASGDLQLAHRRLARRFWLVEQNRENRLSTLA